MGATRFMSPSSWTEAGAGRPREACRAARDTTRAWMPFAVRSWPLPASAIGTLTLHAFSSHNWQRPAGEVRELMSIFEDFLRSSAADWAGNGIKVSVFGRRSRLAPSLAAAIEAAEAATREGWRLHLRLAIDYSARDAILSAARRLGGGEEATPERFARLLAGDGRERGPVPDLDLLIRTGGEQRLSDFLLWECASAEFLFLDAHVAGFWGCRSRGALCANSSSRERRFGRIPEAVAR